MFPTLTPTEALLIALGIPVFLALFALAGSGLTPSVRHIEVPVPDDEDDDA